MSSWLDVHHFTAHELGSPGAVNPEIDQRLIALGKCLDIYRFKCSAYLSGEPGATVKIPVHCGYQIRPDSPTSQHNFGRAADLNVLQNEGTIDSPRWKNVDLFKQWFLAEACSTRSLKNTMDFVLQTFVEYNGQVISVNRMDSWVNWMEFVYKDIHIESMFTGIGIYGEWNNPGLHLDMRPGNSARWVCIGKKYVELDGKNLIMALESSEPKTNRLLA